MATDFKPRSRKSRKATPGWVWLSSGLVGGLIIGFAAYALLSMWQRPPHEKKPAHKPAVSKKAAPADDSADDDKPRYDFYTLRQSGG